MSNNFHDRADEVLELLMYRVMDYYWNNDSEIFKSPDDKNRVQSEAKQTLAQKTHADLLERLPKLKLEDINEMQPTDALAQINFERGWNRAIAESRQILKEYFEETK